MKTQITIHGKLGKICGKTFEFHNINSPVDAINAISTIHKDFKQSIINQANQGTHYEMILDGKTQQAFEYRKSVTNIQNIEIVPFVCGADPVSALLASAAFKSFVTTLVVGLVVAGIVYLMTPIPEIAPREMVAPIKGESFIFQSANNVASQGQPVPVGYGRLRVGSQIVSTAVSNKNIDEEPNPFGSEKIEFVEFL